LALSVISRSIRTPCRAKNGPGVAQEPSAGGAALVGKDTTQATRLMSSIAWWTKSKPRRERGVP
jgi:hypothetical protein